MSMYNIEYNNSYKVTDNTIPHLISPSCPVPPDALLSNLSVSDILQDQRFC